MENKQRKLRWGRCALLVLVVIAVFVLTVQLVGDGEPRPDDEQPALPSLQLAAPAVLAQNQARLAAGLSSEQVVLVSLPDQRVLLDIAAGERIYPASLTKIVTAIVAIEQIADLESTISVPEDIQAAMQAAKASVVGFQAGQEVRAIDLLYGALLPSGADAAICLALLASGTQSDFIAEMNALAGKLSLADTHFTNVIGLHDEEHYSTARDIAVLLIYALENPQFREIFCSESYLLPAVAAEGEEPRQLRSSLFARLETAAFTGGEILGGKTGYTGEAGQCLASYAVKDGQHYLLVTTGAPGKPGGEPLHIEDALYIYEHY